VKCNKQKKGKNGLPKRGTNQGKNWATKKRSRIGRDGCQGAKRKKNGEKKKNSKRIDITKEPGNKTRKDPRGREVKNQKDTGL